MEIVDNDIDKNSFNIMRASQTSFQVQEMPIKQKIDTLIDLAYECSDSIKINQKQIFMLRSEFGTIEHTHNSDTRYFSECVITDIYKLGKELKAGSPSDIEELCKIQQQIIEEESHNRKTQEDIYILTNRVNEVENDLGVTNALM